MPEERGSNTIEPPPESKLPFPRSRFLFSLAKQNDFIPSHVKLATEVMLIERLLDQANLHSSEVGSGIR
jgi:hypothetical protein